MSERIKLGLCILVGIAWAANVTLSMFQPSYESDPAINVAFTAVLGIALATGKDKKSE